jgi:hypothetical protein
MYYIFYSASFIIKLFRLFIFSVKKISALLVENFNQKKGWKQLSMKVIKIRKYY